MTVLRPAGDFDISYQQDMGVIRQRYQWGLLLVTIAAVATAPYWANTYFITTFNEFAYTLIAVQGLSILTGYTGQISLGQAAFMLVGGYISAILAKHMGLSFFLTVPLAALGTGLVGLLFGLPSLRVKGFYLTMATLAAQFIIPWLTRHTFPDLMGGSGGRISVPPPQIGSFAYTEGADYIYISLIALIIMTVLTLNITRTRLGRVFVAIRDNDLAAELLGVNLFAYKLRAFFLAALYAGVAGALKAHLQREIGTELGYGLEVSIFMLAMLVIGGLGTNIGPFFGAAAIILLEDVANLVGGLIASTFPGQASNVLTSFRPLFFGLVLMLFLIYEPRGLAYRWNLMKAAWRLRPFSR